MIENSSHRFSDKVVAYLAAVDTYVPAKAEELEDLYPLFARQLSRSLDGRYLEKHPPKELLPAIEQLLVTCLDRRDEEIIVQMKPIDDGTHTRAILITASKDQPFIISVIRLALEWKSVKILRSFNTIIPVRRETSSGRITGLGIEDQEPESFLWAEIEGENLLERQKSIVECISARLKQIQLSVLDYPSMQDSLTKCAKTFYAQAEKENNHQYQTYAQFLDWLQSKHFVVLGTKWIALKEEAQNNTMNLGIGNQESLVETSLELGLNEEDSLRELAKAPFLKIQKSKVESWLYRTGPLNRVAVSTLDAEANPDGILLIEGLFTFEALAEPKASVPMLNQMMQRILENTDARQGSHRHRTIRKAFNSLPLDYLFALDENNITKLVEELLNSDAEEGIQIHTSLDQKNQSAFVFVILPRSYYSDDLRGGIRRLLSLKLGSRSVDDGVYSGNGQSVSLHYFLTGIHDAPANIVEQLQEQIKEQAQPWSIRLKNQIYLHFGETQARELFYLYRDAFPARYREETSVKRAIKDIEILQSLTEEMPYVCEIYREKTDQRLDITRLRLAETSSSLLSDILPILDNLGLVVVDQYPTSVLVPERPDLVVSTFRIKPAANINVDLTTRRNRLSSAITAAMAGACENDIMNRLLLKSDIPWTYVSLLRAYHHYAWQLGSPYGKHATTSTLEKNPTLVRSITEFFRVKFDPELQGTEKGKVCPTRQELVDRASRTLLEQIDELQDLQSDQIFRRLYNLVDATLRTNFYNRDPHKQPRIVLKMEPARIVRIPEPRPFREIYVHHPLVEGLHLRGGMIARGGIRWSDRRRDFRTEVLGLMHTQNLKNVVIVPEGAKGAFIVKGTYDDPQDFRKAGVEAYKIFINGLLEVTDNLSQGNIIKPENILCYDQDDSYLVVAADKGTAAFSDTANGVARQNQFWLDDAFASGGSNGYDHKIDGVTAKGAWESVKRHFREMGLHPEKDVITVAGIGDMSGDVFGNGLLLSKTMKLLAAFDHRNIFIDPKPDPTTSHEVRLKLFNMKRSSWEDYPKDQLSPGGGIYPRNSKSIALSDEAKKALGIKDDKLSGPDLIKEILKAPVDLLWNGGIGTYIKSDKETNLQVGDPSNDQVRIDAPQVRAKVIGEGGNLGITPQGRCQLAARETRLNTDAVDNSGGVDLSDHEVNIKILLSKPQERGDLTSEQRNILLEEVRADVNKTVLGNNWKQGRMLSLDQIRSQTDLPHFQRAIEQLAADVGFDRQLANLPTDPELDLRAQNGIGLHRPELASLASYAKMFIRQELVAYPTLIPKELWTPYLQDYFPELLQSKFPEEILAHPLARNIADTMLTNTIVNDTGASWISDMLLQTGGNTVDILRSHLYASKIIEMNHVKEKLFEIEANLDPTIEYLIRMQIEHALNRTCLWLMRNETMPQKDSFEQNVKFLHENLSTLLPQEDEERRAASSLDLVGASVPEDLATPLSKLEYVDEILDIAEVLSKVETNIELASKLYFIAGAQSGLLEFIRGATQSYNTSRLEKPARTALRGQLRSALVNATALILQSGQMPENLNSQTLESFQKVARDLSPLSNGRFDLSSLVLAVDRSQHNLVLYQSSQKL